MRVIFTEAIVGDQAALLVWWRENIGPVLGKTFAHHMTIKFKPSDAEVAVLDMGAPVSLKIVGYAEDEKGQAVAVQPVGVSSVNENPHITISTDGRSPVYSNGLLEAHVKPIDGPTIFATVGYFNGKEHCTE